MIVTYRPEEAEQQRWEFDPKQVRAAEAEIIEKRTGLPWDQFVQAVMQGATRPRRVLLWYLLKRQHPTLKLEDVDYAIGELEIEFTRAELLALREQAVQARGLTEEQREQALAALDTALDEAQDTVEGDTAGDTVGKALWRSAG